MAKIQRVLQKIFGSSAPVNECAQIGSDFTPTPLKTKDLAQIQGGTQYPLGLYGITADASQPPRIEDLNALYYMLTTQLAYLFQAGIPEWNPETPYYQGSLVNVAGEIYVSRTGSSNDTADNPNLGNNPTTDTANWQSFLKDLRTAIDQEQSRAEDAEGVLQKDISAVRDVVEDTNTGLNTKTPIDMSSMNTITPDINSLLHVDQGKAKTSDLLSLLKGNAPSIVPSGNGQQDIGSSAKRIATGYINNLDSGNGAGAYWPMDQAVRKTDSPTFATLPLVGTSWDVEKEGYSWVLESDRALYKKLSFTISSPSDRIISNNYDIPASDSSIQRLKNGQYRLFIAFNDNNSTLDLGAMPSDVMHKSTYSFYSYTTVRVAFYMPNDNPSNPGNRFIANLGGSGIFTDRYNTVFPQSCYMGLVQIDDELKNSGVSNAISVNIASYVLLTQTINTALHIYLRRYA